MPLTTPPSAPASNGVETHSPFLRIPLLKIGQRSKARPFDRGARPRDHLYASDLGKCPRAVWLTWRFGHKRDPYFEDYLGPYGHALEDLIADQLGGLVCAREVSFRDERVSGRADFFLRLRHRGTQIPAELKSTAAFERFVSEPLPTHVFQLRWYLAQEPRAKFGVLIYLSSQYKAWKDDALGEWKRGDRILSRWVALKIPRDDEAVTREVGYLWHVVHQPNEPACSYVPQRAGDECFDCANARERGAEARRDVPA